MDNGRRGRGRGRGRGHGHGRGGRGVREVSGRWSPRPSFNHPQPQPRPPPPNLYGGRGGRWCPRPPFNHPQPQPRPPPPNLYGGRGGRWCPRPPFIHPQPPPPVAKSGEVDDDSGSVSGSNDPGFSIKHDTAASAMMPLSSPPSQVSDTSICHQTHPIPDDPSFDICPTPKQAPPVTLNPSLLLTNRERRRGRIQSELVLRPGMVLLKSHISLPDQVKIVKTCRELGVGHGGFYQPGYVEGTKLHLKMMCLGKHWDPHSSQYGDHRPHDGAKPPNIPPQFHQLVHSAITCSHAVIPQDSQTSLPHKVLPHISPDICIVNFYSQSGRLGLHQDKDESQQSLRQGLPVVSFSIGDSADFLYGDERDMDKAQKVVLESGDVLIFGGSSRHVFHGVTAIHPTTAPNLLLQQTNLRPGRLNLTFRQY